MYDPGPDRRRRVQPVRGGPEHEHGRREHPREVDADTEEAADERPIAGFAAPNAPRATRLLASIFAALTVSDFLHLGHATCERIAE